MAPKKIVVFGSINQDFFSYVERFPRPGESVRGRDFRISNGGKGANQTVTIANLGAEVTMIGMVGDDMFADAVLKNLKESGVNTDLIQKVPNINTGCAVITVNEEDNENNIIVTPGANDKMTAQRAADLESHIVTASLIICQAEISEDANMEAFRLAKKHGVTTLLNPAPCNPSMNRDILNLTDILIVNETETEIILKKELSSNEDFKQAAQELVTMGPRISIISLGKQGAILTHLDHNNEIHVYEAEAPKVDAIDTTGAGDCLVGSFGYLLVNYSHLNYAEMIQKAVKIAAVSVTRRGCQPSYPSFDEIKQLGII